MKYVVCIIICVFIVLCIGKNHTTFSFFSVANSDKDSTIYKEKYVSKIKEAKQYVRLKQFDTSIALFINYQIHSGKKRAFLIDLIQQKAIDSFVVSHGCGDSPWGSDQSKTSPKFSNLPESHCSSLGKFKITQRGYSNWGINVKYNLIGMESTNSNALKRLIVLHGWDDVSNSETFPNGAPEGWGCPAFSNLAMTKLDSFFKSKSRPVLLWSY